MARRLNDSMGAFVASQITKMMIANDIKIKDSKVLHLGITFKKNCPDIRNSKAIDVIQNLKEYGVEVLVLDPWANPDEVINEYNFKSENNIDNILKFAEINSGFDTIVLTVAHEQFLNLDLKKILKNNGVIYDVKGFLPINNVNKRL